MKKTNKDDAFAAKLTGFADRLKSTDQQTPIQQVTPVPAPVKKDKGAASEDEEQLSTWIPKDLNTRLKLRGIQDRKKIKLIVIEALEAYLS